MSKRLIPFCLLVLLPFLSGCEGENEFTTWSCRFVYDNAIHLDQTLATATNPNIMGIFCKVTEEVRGGTKYLVFENNQGLSSKQIETAEELRYNMRIGLNNGIVIGHQNDGVFVAYDLQCPNCVRKENNMISPNYPIRLDDKGTGIATCSKCGKKYDLNSGGLIQNGGEGDKGLERYRNANTQGPQGRTTVLSQ